MTKKITSGVDRRSFLRQAAAVAGGVAVTTSTGVLSQLAAFAQDPPNGCPAPPTGGTPFVPGQDKRPIALRKSINLFSASELTELENAFAALRSLPASDP